MEAMVHNYDWCQPCSSRVKRELMRYGTELVTVTYYCTAAKDRVYLHVPPD